MELNGDGLSRAAILAAGDIESERVEVPEWGGAVWVRTMDGRERDAFEGHQIAHPWEDIRARLAVITVCDSGGQALFNAGDVAAISRKSGRALDRIFEVSARLSGLGKKDIDELKKNSSTILSSDSSIS
jgi:hypothetical protein